MKPSSNLIGFPIAAACSTALSCSAAYGQSEPTLEASARIGVWSSDRQSRSDKSLFNAEAWVRGDINPGTGIKLHGEAWAATNPVGDGESHPGGDVREGAIEVRMHGFRTKAGRQIFAWGKADRVNPTDVMGARDYRRLVEDEEENRLGMAAVSVSGNLADGTLSAFWVPEFRASRLPQNLGANGLDIITVRPHHQSAYALRYERFGNGLDFSVTAAETPDRLPWLSIEPIGASPALFTPHPKMRMVGADAAFALGNYNLRLEAARYWYELAGFASTPQRKPNFAAVVGIDHSFPGQWFLLAQGLIRTSSGTLPKSPAPLEARNATIHGAWRKSILGATFTARKAFADESGQAEVTAAILQNGGSFQQARLIYRLKGSVRIRILGERHRGETDSYLGSLRKNDLFMIGLRAGF